MSSLSTSQLTHLRPSTKKHTQDSDYAELPRNLRIISRNISSQLLRLCLLLVIGISFAAIFFFPSYSNPVSDSRVKGARSEPVDESNVAVDETTLNEIKTTIRILEVRPDYAAAWQKLGFLYEKASRQDLARVAYDEAKKLGSGF